MISDEDRKKRSAYMRKWRAANAEKSRAAHRAWYATHREKVAEYNRQWVAANPEKKRATEHRRRALKAGNGGSYTVAEWQDLRAQYNNQCLGPGPHQGPLQPDHVVPLKLGGTSNIDNIQPLCQKCNEHKHTKVIDYRY